MNLIADEWLGRRRLSYKNILFLNESRKDDQNVNGFMFSKRLWN